MTIKEIETRMAAIREECKADDADLDALTAEAEQLQEQRTALVEKEEKRNKILAGIANTPGTPAVVVPTVKEARSFDSMTHDELITTPEYRTAYFMNLAKQPMGGVEQRLWTTAITSGGAAVPKETANQILEKLYQTAPLTSEITLNHVNGDLRYPLEDETTAAVSHTEGAVITDSVDTLKFIDLHQYEIVKKTPISDSQMKMAIPAFEAYVNNRSGLAIGHKVTDLIMNGSGTGEATGIETQITWGTNNSLTAAASGVTYKNVLDLVSMLPGVYDDNAKFLVSKKALYKHLMPLMDKSKHDLVYRDGKNFYVLGYPVLLDQRISDDSIYLGDFRQYIANMAEQVTLVPWFDGDRNIYKILAKCMFDGKVGREDAFVKLTVGSTPVTPPASGGSENNG